MKLSLTLKIIYIVWLCLSVLNMVKAIEANNKEAIYGWLCCLLAVIILLIDKVSKEVLTKKVTRTYKPEDLEK